MTVKVTFVPIPGFSGTAKGVTVSPMASVGRDRDGKMSDNALKTATDKYLSLIHIQMCIRDRNKVLWYQWLMQAVN